MANLNDPRPTSTAFGSVPRAGGQVVFDAGLRKHMLSIYNYMTSGVLLTGIVALLTFNAGLATGPVMWIGLLGSVGLALALGFASHRFSETGLKAMYWAYAGLLGLGLSSVFAIYTGGSIAVTFFATAASFAALSLWGYTTEKSLSAWGSFLMMGVVGLLVAGIANFFLQSPALHYATGALGVLIFAGLTAYDTQRLKNEYAMLRGTELAGRAVVLGALSLYMDFINMFLFLLRFLGSRE